jgi:hypothetical protein
MRVLTKLLRVCPGTERVSYHPLRSYWWGHDTIEDQYDREKAKKDRDVIAWSKPGSNLEEKKEFTWAPARISQESQLAKGRETSYLSKWTGTTSVFEFTTKYKPMFWKALFYPEEGVEQANKMKYSALVASQEFVKERLLVLGPDLAAAHFLCYNHCRVRFRGHKEWTELTGRGVLDIPAVYVPGWHIEAIDISSSRIIYEGLQNLRNLHHLKYLDISYCEYMDVWCLDRISGEYADSIEYINLSGCRNVDWNALEVLWRFKNLKTLVLKDMDHVEDLTLICLLLLDVFPNLRIVGAEYMDPKLLEGTEFSHLLEEDFVPKLEPGDQNKLTSGATS